MSDLASRLTDDDLAAISDRFEGAPATAAIEWAVEAFGSRVCVAASMTDAVLIDLALKVDPGVDVVFIDTGYHFPETLDTVKAVETRYGCDVRVLREDPPPDPPLWQVDPANCCSAMKVALLERALVGKDAWLTGIRRDEAHTRASAPIVQRDKRGLVKVNPLATWTELDVQGYIADHDIVVNPLLAQGYASIGCWPCTRPVSEGEHPRAGRWAGSDKVECGLHL
jgi:phosphoadenosine phosphosulfate reductase